MFEHKYLKNVATLGLDQSKCNGCKMCIVVCPHEVFAMNIKKVKIIDLDSCMECGACELNCPTEAITVKAGVGCAAAVLTGMIRSTEPSCDCGVTEEPVEDSCCCSS